MGRMPSVLVYRYGTVNFRTMLLAVLFLNYMVFIFALDCVTPPVECPNKNITFWLYTRANQDDPYQLLADDDKSLALAPWVKDAPIKILVHGYTGHKDFSPNTEIRPEFMKCCDYNIISVDYNPIAREPCYLSAAKNTMLVGKCLAQLVDRLVVNHDFELSRFHLIGFSLGGHVVGFAGKNLESGTFDRITALDPALPLFVTQDTRKKLDASDGKYVDVLHTNALGRGKLETCGTSDFYANGGLVQPGCKTTANESSSSCAHRRAPEYYAESINTDLGFYATKCYSWISYMIGWCELVDSNEEVLYGEYMSLNVTGLYFFRTNSKPSFARGSNKKEHK